MKLHEVKNTQGSVHPQDVINVVSFGYCIGCGACASPPGNGSSITIEDSADGFYVANLSYAKDDEIIWANSVCPFANNLTEDEISTILYGTNQKDTFFSNVIGYYKNLYSGYSIKYRSKGSSGGMATWLIIELLEQEKIDYVVHVGETGKENPFFSYKTSSSVDEVTARSTSVYYPVSLAETINSIRNAPGRYAITAIPCFAKALRLAMNSDPVLSERICFIIGIVCGQMKSKFYLEYLSRKAGIVTGIEHACFRRKDVYDTANNYSFEAVFRDSENQCQTKSIKNSKIGTNWGMGYFKPKACDYCDDVFAETADIAFMDGWLPKYIDDGNGTSLFIVRSEKLGSLIEDEKNRRNISLENISLDDVVESQKGGLNHRRLGLRYRLYINQELWMPAKRVKASDDFHWVFKIDQLLRRIIRDASSTAMLEQKKRPGIAYFESRLKIWVLLYKAVNRVKSKLKGLGNRAEIDYGIDSIKGKIN